MANSESANVSAYSISSNGALTRVPGSPFSAGVGPISVAVDPTSKFAYVANFGSNSVSAYGIGPNGALTPIPGSPFAAGVSPFQWPSPELFPNSLVPFSRKAARCWRAPQFEPNTIFQGAQRRRRSLYRRLAAGVASGRSRLERNTKMQPPTNEASTTLARLSLLDAKMGYFSGKIGGRGA